MDVGFLRHCQAHALSGYVIDMPLIRFPVDKVRPTAEVQRCWQTTTQAYVTVGHGSHHGREPEDRLTILTVRARRLVVGVWPGVHELILASVGPTGEDRRHRLVPEFVAVAAPADLPQLGSYQLAFEITRQSLRAFTQQLLSGSDRPLDLDYQFYPCAVCGVECLMESRGSFESCPLCGWEDEDWFCSDELSPNHMTVAEAKARFAAEAEQARFRARLEVWSKYVAGRRYGIDRMPYFDR